MRPSLRLSSPGKAGFGLRSVRTLVLGRLVSLAMATASVFALASTIAVACYTVPRPDCGFVCGPDDACPEGYTCADDHRCHRIGAPGDLVCSTIDAPLPVDASPDAPPDAPPDPPDAPDDAMIDASIDAP